MSDEYLLLVFGEKSQLRQSVNYFRLKNLKANCLENDVRVWRQVFLPTSTV
jgi:hypothetical protein